MRLFVAIAFIVFSSLAVMARKFSPPTKFENGYTLPTTQHPLARVEWMAYLDVAVLLIALALAAYLVLWRRSRRGVVILSIASLLYFGFFRHGCICPVGAIQNVTLAIWNHQYALPITVAAFFVLPLLFALFFGRVFCAAVCPFGAAQDLVLLRPIKLPAWLTHALSVLPYVYLGAAVLFAATGTAFLICKYDPFIIFFRHSGSLTMLIISVAMVLVAMVVGRPYCRFLCPYGVLLRWLAPFARWRVSITPGSCIQCRLCEESCPYDAIDPPTPEPNPALRRAGKGALAGLLFLLPVLVAGGALLGHQAGPAMARLDPIVRTAELVWMKEHILPEADPNEVLAFENTNRETGELYQEAQAISARITTGARWLGGWIGLVIGLKLILLSLRRRRVDYEADPAACLACARCYKYCPVKQGEQTTDPRQKVVS